MLTTRKPAVRRRTDISRRADSRRRFLQHEKLEDRSLLATLSSFLTTEHVDLGLNYGGGVWSFESNDEAVSRSLDDALHYVGESAIAARPGDSAFDFIGVPAGQDFYRLAQSQDPLSLYLGFNAQDVPTGEVDRYSPTTESKGRINSLGRWVKVSLVEVNGPGTFSAWQSEDFGPNVFMSSYNDGVANPNANGLDVTDGITADDSLWVIAGGHTHFNFGFTAAGRYEVTLRASFYQDDGNTTVTGPLVQSQTFTVYFSVENVGQLEFDQSTYTVNESAGTASINVRRVGGSDGRLAVSYATSNGTAITPADYAATSGTLTFNDLETTKTFTIPIVDDAIVEPNETVLLALSNPQPANFAAYLASVELESLIGPNANATLTIIDNDTNTPPTISDIADQSTNEDVPLNNIPFTVGDAQTPVASLLVSAASSNPTLLPVGNITFGGSEANRTVSLNPAANQFGTTTVTITVTDGSGATASDSFVLTVISVNDLPTISDIPNQSTPFNTPLGPLNFTIGDVETAAGVLAVSATSSNTTVVPNANLVLGGSGSARTLTITPAAGQSGSTTITVTVTDADGGVRSDTFDLVVGTNTLPTISDVTNQTTNEDTSTAAIPFTVGDVETPAGSLVVTATSTDLVLVPNANIVLGGTGVNRTVQITPALNQFGTTTITLTVTDAHGGTAVDTFLLTVNSVNDLPTISDIPNQSTPFNTPLGPLNFTIGDVETAAGVLGVSATSSNTTVVPNANLVLGGSGSARTLTITPAAGQSGSTTITVTVTDADGGVRSDTFDLLVGANTLPTISDVANQATNEDTSTAAIPFTVGDVETPAGSLVVTATSSDLALVPNANIVLGGTGVNRTVQITPATNQFGSTIITLTVTDAHGGTAVDTFLLTVNSVNDLPTISDIPNQSTPFNTPLGPLSFTVGDVETPAGSLVVTGSSSNQVLVPNGNIVFGGSGANRTVTITPAAGQSGTTTITVTVTDEGGLTATDTLVVTVAPAPNAPPTISDIGDLFVVENTSTAPLAFTVGDAETPAANLVVTATSSNTALVPNGNIVLGGSGANRTITLTPAANQVGSTTITVTVIDQGGLQSSDTFILTVNPLPGAPIGHDDVFTVDVGRSVYGNVLFNDVDPDGDSLTAVVNSLPAHGTLAFQSNGAFSYTPSTTYAGADSFTYTASDGGLSSSTVTVTFSLSETPGFEAILANEHVDIGVAFGEHEHEHDDDHHHHHHGEEEPEWDLHVHDHTNDVEYDPSTVLLSVGNAALSVRQGALAGAAFDFLGVPVGGTFYRLPQTVNPELLLLGLGTEEIEDGTFDGGTLQLQLVSVVGPGNFSVWRSTDTGPDVVMATSDGVTTADLAELLEGGHDDVNWAFGAAGNYAVTFQASGIHEGEYVESEPVTYYFSVDSGTLTATLQGVRLTIEDISGSANNSFTVDIVGTDLVISDAVHQFVAAPPGGVLTNGNRTLVIPLTSVGYLIINGRGGDDTFVVHATSSLLHLTLDGGDGNDSFGTEAEPLTPSLATSLTVIGGGPSNGMPLPYNPQQNAMHGNTAGDLLYLDMTDTRPVGGQTVTFVDTVGGVARSFAASGQLSFQPIGFGGVESIFLTDANRSTLTQMGDVFVQGRDSMDLIQFSRAPDVTNPFKTLVRVLGVPVQYATLTNRTIGYGRGGDDILNQTNVTMPAILFGEVGNDRIDGGIGNDLLVGGLGNDRINASQGDNEVWGDQIGEQDLDIGGADVLSTLTGNDRIYAGGGDDQVYPGGGNDFVHLGFGNDIASGGAGDDRIFGGPGNDVISGDAGNDWLDGGDGNDFLMGRTGNDIVIGGNGADNINTDEGNDILITDRLISAISAPLFNSSSPSLAGDANDLALLGFLQSWGQSPNASTLAAFGFGYAADSQADNFNSGTGNDFIRRTVDQDRNGDFSNATDTWL